MVLGKKSFNFAKDSKYDTNERGIALMGYRFFDKKSSGGVIARVIKPAIKSEFMTNQQLSEELH